MGERVSRRAHGARRGYGAGMAGILVAGVAVLVLNPPARADVLTVTRFDDPAPGACTAGDCSLREAIVDANARPGGPHTIQLPAGTYVIEIAPGLGADADRGDFDITASLTIDGAGAAEGGTIIDARPTPQSASLDRVFQVHSGTVVFQEVQITGGDSSANGSDFGGGGIAVKPGANVTLRDAAVVGNKASAAGPLLTNDGGGLVVDQATLTVEDSTIEDNVVEHASVASGGGIGITATGPSVVTIDGSTIKGNSSRTTGDGSVASGGGVAVGQATVTITDSTFEGNESRTTGLLASEAAGGAISLAAGTVTLDRSTVNGNTAVGTAVTAVAHGGGFAMAAGTLNVENSTISGNTADAPTAEGGGVNSAATVDIAFSTITGNTADTGAGVRQTAGAVRLEGTVVADNTGGDCAGAMTSEGYNLDSDNTCDLGQATDLPAADADLQALADNGGPTRTHALGAASDATDAGGDCDGTVTVDQRGVARPQAVACDMGAFELEPPPPPTTTTTTAPTTTTTAPTTTTTAPTTTTTAPTTTTTAPTTTTTTTPSTTTTTTPSTTTTTTPSTTTTTADAGSTTTTTLARPRTTTTVAPTEGGEGQAAEERVRDSHHGTRRSLLANYERSEDGESSHGFGASARRGARDNEVGEGHAGLSAVGVLLLAVVSLFLFPLLARRRRRDDDAEQVPAPG